MKLTTSAVRNSLLCFFLLLAFVISSAVAFAQEGPATKDQATSAKYPAAKAQGAEAAETDADANLSTEQPKAGKVEKDSPEAIRKRNEWFYKQRASASGHIPAGARAQALAHRDRMMEAEGKLVRRADGSVAEVAPAAPAAGAVTNTWTSIGPTPTAGGFFSPVTGRITAIAIDPSDATGNTVLIGGAQGGIWRTTDAGNTWTAVGDQNASLAMGSIAFAPSQPATVYAGTGEQASIGFDIYYGAGVLKSTNSGKTWAQTCTTPSATCPFVGPFNDSSVFGFFSLGGARISYIAVNPTNPLLVLVAAQFALSGNQEGVYCSADGGTTWSNVLPGQMSTFVGFASPTVAFAALGNPFGSNSGGNGTNPNGIYKSTNASSCAMTFASLNVSGSNLPAASSIGRVDMGISPNFAGTPPDNTVYASIANAGDGSSTNLGVWVTTNGGTTWTQQTSAPDVCQAQCWYDNVIKVDPNNSKIAYLGGAAVTSGNAPAWVVRTTDGGNTWASVIPNQTGIGLPHVDTHVIAFVKATSGTFSGKVRAYLGNDGGIWRSDDAEAASITWNNINDSTLTLTQFYPSIAMNVSSPQIAYGGTQDNGSQNFLGPSASWTDNNLCGDGASAATDAAIPSTVYISCGTGAQVNVSYQNAAMGSFAAATNGINPGDNSNFIAPLTADPSQANVLYFGTTKVYQSVDGANSWTPLTHDLAGGPLIAIAVAPKNSAVVYAGLFSGGVLVATNVGAGTGAFGVTATLANRAVTAIAVDPADPTGKTAYVAMSGFSFVGGTINDTSGHIFKTTLAGAAWTDVSCTVANCQTPAATDLPNTPVNDVVVDPDIPGTLYAATDVGVFQGTCTTSSTPPTTTCVWSTLSTGLPRVAVLSLRLHEPSRTLMAATHGRGVWTVVLNNFTATGPHIASLSPVASTAGAASFTLTVNGNGLTGGTIQFGGSPLTTTVVNDSQVTATVPANLGAGISQVAVTVGANASNKLPFAVMGGAPTITASSPGSASVSATTATQITVTGTNFTPSSQVVMDPDVLATPIPTTFNNSTSLTAMVPAGFFPSGSAAGFGSTNSVGVRNPPPGGGTTLTNLSVNPNIILPTFVESAPAPANANFANAIVLPSTSGTTFTDTKDSSAAAQIAAPIPACAQSVTGVTTGVSNAIWYKFTPTSNGTITDVDTIGSSYDTVLSIWTGSSQTALTAVACNDDIVPGIVIQSQLTNVPVTSGTTYFILVSSFGFPDPNPIALGGKSIFNFTFTSSAATGNFTITGTGATVNAGSSGSSTITVTPAAGTTGNLSVNVTCGTIPGVTCTPNPLTINTAGATPASNMLTINVLANSSSMTASAMPAERTLYAAGMPSAPPRNGKGWWMLSAATGMAAILLLLLPGRKKYRAAFVGLGIICVVSFAIGCGGGSSGGGGGGPASTTTTMTASSTKVPSNSSITVSATVTGGTPGGTVQFFVDGAAIGNPAALTNGSTGQITVTAAQAPAFLQLVGTHAVQAKYSGDSKTLASQSGTLEVAVTGTTTLTITGTAASGSANGNVSLTIQ